MEFIANDLHEYVTRKGLFCMEYCWNFTNRYFSHHSQTPLHLELPRKSLPKIPTKRLSFMNPTRQHTIHRCILNLIPVTFNPLSTLHTGVYMVYCARFFTALAYMQTMHLNCIDTYFQPRIQRPLRNPQKLATALNTNFRYIYIYFVHLYVVAHRG